MNSFIISTSVLSRSQRYISWFHCEWPWSVPKYNGFFLADTPALYQQFLINSAQFFTCYLVCKLIRETHSYDLAPALIDEWLNLKGLNIFKRLNPKHPIWVYYKRLCGKVFPDKATVGRHGNQWVALKTQRVGWSSNIRFLLTYYHLCHCKNSLLLCRKFFIFL